jgi:copper homeostasis protein CutC
MKTKAVLEKLRALEESSKISFQREIDVCLDQLKNLEDLYEEVKNK